MLFFFKASHREAKKEFRLAQRGGRSTELVALQQGPRLRKAWTRGTPDTKGLSIGLMFMTRNSS